MRAEVIAIGDELTSGVRLDTNSQWLSQQLGELGLPVAWHTTVGDDLADNIAAFRSAIARAEVVVCTGGLGPTADDLTRPALAAALDRPLRLNEDQLAAIRNLFARRGRDMPERNRVQAEFPEGCLPIPNPHGTAPGIYAEIPRADRLPCHLFALPGVPAEMKEMWEQSVSPALRAQTGGKVIAHRRFKCFGVGESDLEQMLPDLIRRGRDPSVGITVSQATITLRVTARGDSREAALAKMEETVGLIRAGVGELLFGEEEEELQHAVARVLAGRGAALATAEAVTGGLLVHWLDDLPEAAQLYRGGVVAHDSLSLCELLAPENTVPPEEPLRVSRAAEAVRDRLRADFGLAVGGLTPADGDIPPKVWVAVAGPAGTSLESTRYTGHPEIIRPRTAKFALDRLRRLLG